VAWQVIKKLVSNPDQLHTNSFFAKGIASFGILSEAMAVERHSVSGETWEQELAYVVVLISSDS
jgi:hypothetical protein